MHKLYFSILAFIVLAAGAVNAQGYYYVSGLNDPIVAYTPQGITPKELLSKKTTDVLSAWQALPFSFTFYGKTVNGYYASNNGYITFDQSATQSNPNNTALPSASAPNDAVFAFWDNLDINFTSGATNAGVRSWTSGAAGSRVHVIRWELASPKGTGSTNNFMWFAIALYEKGGFDVVHMFSRLDAASSGTIGAQLDASTAVMVAGGPDMPFPPVGAPGTSDDIIYSFLTGTQAGYDVKGLAITPDRRFGAVNWPAPISIEVRNLGANDITSADVNYMVNGQTFTKNVSGINIPKSGGVATITHPDYWIPTTAGNVTIKVWLSNLNGNPDENTGNDAVEATREILAAYPERRVLVEEFTNASCGPCAAQNPAFNTLVDRNLDVLGVIKYQTAWPGVDPMNAYNKTDVQARVTYYGVSGVPYTRIDGKIPTGASYPGAPANVFNENFDEAMAKAPGFSIKGASTYDVESNRYNINVDLTSLIDASATTPVAYVAVVEDEILYNAAPGTNGEREFYQIMRKMFPNGAGTTLTGMTAGQTKNLTFTYTPDNIVKVNELRLLVWVQSKTTKEVYNAYWTAPNFQTISSIKENGSRKADLKSTIFPNPSSGITNLQFTLDAKAMVTIEITDLLGRNISKVVNNSSFMAGDHKLQFDASGLNKGIYFVNISINGQSAVKKLVVE